MLRSAHMAPIFSIRDRARLEVDAIGSLEESTSLYDVAVAALSASVMDVDRATAEMFQSFLGVPIDLSEEVLRARLFRAPGGLTVLALSIHHAVLDGPSQQIVHSHMQTILEALRRARLPAVPVQDAHVIAHHTVARYMRSLSASPEPVLKHEIRHFRLPFERQEPELNVYGLPIQSNERRMVCSSWHIDGAHVKSAEQSASALEVTLNAYLICTLAVRLHKHLEDRVQSTEYRVQNRGLSPKHSAPSHIAISQTYLGRGREELRFVGSYSVGVPMVFDFTAGPNLKTLCRHALGETQRILALDTIVQSTQPVAVAYELNDVRPLKRPPETRQLAHPFQTDVFFAVSRFVDGYTIAVVFDEHKYDAHALEAFVQSWIVKAGSR